MNILSTKSWHVRNRDNKERVRKDEENARLEEKKEKERIALAEQEARLSLLRKKRNSIQPSQQQDTGGDTESKAIKENRVSVPENKHINLFATEENEGDTSRSKENPEYMKEKQLEKESYEKKIGLLTFLGQTSLDEKREKKGPWYLEKTKQIIKRKSKDDVDNDSEDTEEEKDVSRKFRLDPMSVVEKHLKHNEHKHKKHKKKHKKDKKGTKSSSSSSSSSKSMEQLRAERLKRERGEREKSEKLLIGSGAKKNDNTDKETSSRYNSQYMPHLSKSDHRGNRWKPY